MRIRKFAIIDHNSLTALLGLAALVLLSACSVNVKKNAEGEDKKVDIQTPFGGIHVSANADPRDIGVSLYPGAKLKEKDSEHDSKRANVDISGPGFGVKVLAMEYVSNDPPEKVIDFYRDQLKQFGSVLECRTNRHAGEEHPDAQKPDKSNNKDSKPVTCDKDNNGKTVELKVGTEDNQRIVAVEPEAKGCNFALVYVQTRGKREMI